MESRTTTNNEDTIDVLSSSFQGLKNKKILITGASGQLGSELLTILRILNCYTKVLSRHQSINDIDERNVFIGDLTKKESIKGLCKDIDIIFHLASYSGLPGNIFAAEEEEHYDVTVNGTINLLEEAIESSVSCIVFCSSILAFDESEKNKYGSAKRQAEELIVKYCKDKEISTRLLRFPPFYGTLNNGNIGKMISAIDRKVFPNIPEMGDRRSLIHVKDAALALIYSLQDNVVSNRVYTVTDGEYYSIRGIYLLISKYLNRKQSYLVLPPIMMNIFGYAGDIICNFLKLKFPFNSVVLKKMRKSSFYDGSEYIAVTGFKPKYDLEKAMPDMISTYQKDSTAQNSAS